MQIGMQLDVGLDLGTSALVMQRLPGSTTTLFGASSVAASAASGAAGVADPG